VSAQASLFTEVHATSDIACYLDLDAVIRACLPERPWPESPTCMSHQHFPVILLSLHAVRQIDRRDPGHPCTLVEVASRDCGPIAPRALGRLRRLPVDLNSIDSPLSRPHLAQDV